jgi:hypothetical protein
MRYVFHSQVHPWRRGIGLHIGVQDLDGSMSVARNIRLERMKEGEIFADPVMQLDMASAQSLMDELWHAGIRPSEGSGSAGSLAATERHLADMRALVFKTKVAS